MNWLWADRQPEVLFVPSEGEKPGWTMQPQDMIIWKGMELLCYSRRYCKKSPVTGAVYLVESWDAQKITVSLHPDYNGEKLFDTPPAEPVDDENVKLWKILEMLPWTELQWRERWVIR